MGRGDVERRSRSGPRDGGTDDLFIAVQRGLGLTLVTKDSDEVERASGLAPSTGRHPSAAPIVTPDRLVRMWSIFCRADVIGASELARKIPVRDRRRRVDAPIGVSRQDSGSRRLGGWTLACE